MGSLAGPRGSVRAALVVVVALAAAALLLLVTSLRPVATESAATTQGAASGEARRRRRVTPPDHARTPRRTDVAGDPDWDTAPPLERRVASVRQLAGDSSETAETSLVAAAHADPSTDVREAALEALESRESLAALSAFVDSLADPDEWVREAAATGLYRFPERSRAMGALAGLCRRDDRQLRIRAAELLDEMVDLQLPWDEIEGGPVVFAWAPPDPLEQIR